MVDESTPSDGEASERSVVFLHTSDELYGSDRMLLEMVDAAADRLGQAQVHVWLPSDLDHPPAELALCTVLEARGVPVRHLDLPVMRRANQNPRGLLRLLRSGAALVRELRSVRPDLVYCTTSGTLLAAPLARLTGASSVALHLQEIWSPGDARLLAPFAACCHTLVCISDAAASSLPAGLARRANVVPNGVPEPLESLTLDARKGDLTFLVASRWNGWKGHRTLLRAWGDADHPGSLLVLGGPPPSGESVDVRELLRTTRHAEDVQVIGEVDDPSVFVNQADVVIIPSDKPEPFGLVAIEAFALGRPVIASAGGGLLDIVSDGQDGWLYPLGDAPALSRLIESLTRAEVVAAGRAARQTYEARFSAARFAQDWSRVVLGARR